MTLKEKRLYLINYLLSEQPQYKDMAIPAIILIPGREGSLGIGMKNVHSSVERAVGADIG